MQDVKLSVSVKLEKIISTIAESNRRLADQIQEAAARASAAESQVKSYKMKLGAAKSLIAATKSNLDDYANQTSRLRDDLSKAQDEIVAAEGRNESVLEEMDALKTRLEMEVQLKVCDPAEGAPPAGRSERIGTARRVPLIPVPPSPMLRVVRRNSCRGKHFRTWKIWKRADAKSTSSKPK
jgi:hypothetical protein